MTAMHLKSREAITMDMAAERSGRGRLKPFLLGIISALGAGVLIGLIVVATGIVSVSTQWEMDTMDSFLSYASRRSIAHHAKNITNPFRNDEAALAVGLDHYKENCLDCHAAPGLPSSEFARGLSPPAPALTSDRVQKMNDGELFWVASNGIRMTGMPAFSATHDEEELWKIVAFVRHLGDLSDEEKAELAAGREDESAHHDHPHAEVGEPEHGAQEAAHAHESGADIAHEAEPQNDDHEHADQEGGVAKAAEGHQDEHEHGEVPTPAQPEQQSEHGHIHETASEPARDSSQEGAAHQEHAGPSSATTAAPPTDDEIIREQKPSYPPGACVISGEELGNREEPVDYVVQERLVRLCCKDCKQEVDKDPASVFERIDAEVIAAQKPSYPLNYDPVTGEILGEGAIDYVHGTRLVRLANEGSVALFLKAPKDALAIVDKALIDTQRASYPLDTCVVTEKTLGSMEGGPLDYLYGTRLVRFCCKECPPKFESDPAAYLEKLDEAAKGKAK
jgi:mono/diheme cytochrome c family protein